MAFRRPYKPPTPEAILKRSIKDLLRTLGIFYFSALQGLGSYPGVSDFLGIYKGRFLAIEAKAPHGVASPAQKEFLRRIEADGGIAILAYTIEDVINGLGVQDRFLKFG